MAQVRSSSYVFGRRDLPFGRDALRMSDMVLCAFLGSVDVVQVCAIRTRLMHREISEYAV
jgi:hypothetical protein